MNDFSAAKAIYIGSDHAGFALKEVLVAALREEGKNVVDMGPMNAERTDYPDYARTVCAKVLESGDPGILICGTGIGMSIAANRRHGIRAAVCTHEFHARAAREHNNANILCIGERVTAPGLAVELARIFLSASFTGGRHEARVAKIEII
ncbi:ribose 5-phosphate isomerase B [Desulfovibrio sp. OttesenSCG-928-I05]|nr:ribose 5-phosphate isomerase B [Desulfovibrio sp. OttesenSCG-928-I05]